MTPQMNTPPVEAMLDYIAKQSAEIAAAARHTAEASHATAVAVRTIKTWVVFLGIVSVLAGGLMALMVLAAIGSAA